MNEIYCKKIDNIRAEHICPLCKEIDIIGLWNIDRVWKDRVWKCYLCDGDYAAIFRLHTFKSICKEVLDERI